jgi:preprotein translocase subunit SecD
MLNPFRKVILILILTAACFYISLPKAIPINLTGVGIDLKKTIYRKDLDISLGFIDLQRQFDLKLGLDLAGGSHLVFEADTSELSGEDRKTAIEGLKEVMERRVNLFGISEPNVQTSTFQDIDRIIVELPGIEDTNTAIELIGQTAQLVFAETGTEDEPGLFPTELTGANLKRAQVVFDQTTGEPVVGIEFDEEGAEKFAELTGRNIDKPLAILLDNQVVTAPIVQDQITGGQAQISGDFDTQSARNLSIQLNAGALPVSVKLVEERTIGATLGDESVERSITAGLIGLSMVLLFMILVYGRLGVISDIALVIFGLITLALYKIIPVVLTLPGIAGFLLSVGMAVDSNILIFERFKEERTKRNFKDALEVSFGRAWDSIRDANIATLVTAFILANPLDWPFLHTSGPVRGFAITLALGIFISMFTGVVVSRNLLRVFLKVKKTKKQ